MNIFGPLFLYEFNLSVFMLVQPHLTSGHDKGSISK